MAVELTFVLNYLIFPPYKKKRLEYDTLKYKENSKELRKYITIFTHIHRAGI